MDRFVQAMRTKLMAEIEREVDLAGHGRCSSWDAYKEKTGMVKGLEKALAIFDETFKEVLTDDGD